MQRMRNVLTGPTVLLTGLVILTLTGCGPAWVSPQPPMYPPGQGPQPGQIAPPPSDLGQPATPPPTFDNEQLPGSLREVPTVPADQVLQLPPTAATPRYHQVEAGDTLTSIAQKYGVTVDELLSINGINNADRIRVGEQVRIP